MKSLQQTISEVRLVKDVPGRLHVGGTYSNKLLIFDIDDTLLITDTKVFVTKGGRIVRTLSSAEFNDDVLRPGERYDYSDFLSLKTMKRGVFTPYIKTLRREYAKGTHICILTARNITDKIKQFFLDAGIDIKDELIIAVNDPKQPYTGNVAQRKSQAISSLIEKGEYDTIVFFDDNKENLRQAETVCKALGVKMIPVHVVPTPLRESVDINEGLMLDGETISTAMIVWGVLCSLGTMGLAVTGRLINSMIKTIVGKREGNKRNIEMLKLKDLVKDIDMSDDDLAKKIMNTPGEWSSLEIMELLQHIKNKMTPEQADEYEKLMNTIINKKSILKGL